MVETWVGSYSKLALFEKCPRAYYYKYVQGLEYSTPALELGKKVHEGIAKFITTGVCSVEIAEFITPRVRQKQGIGTECVEKSIRFQVDDVTVEAVIDLITPDEIIDWKTNWVKNADPRQLILYHYGAKRVGLAGVGNKVYFHYLRYNEDEEVDISTNATAITLDWVKATYAAISETQFEYDLTEDIGIFNKTDNPKNCLTCPYRTVCKNVNTTEDAIKLAREIEELEALLELKKEMLRDYIEEYGEIQTEANLWKLTVVNNWDFDTRKVYDYIQSLGKDPLQFLNCTLTNLKKLKIPEQELERLGTKKITYRLAKSKIKEAR
ncbi:conserved hypothetical protein [Caldicellulosiruptor hydrothermalis 108]|uniref:PD-(D/E)XK endonuclease-like domain-containing protein n=1 Tax=Caldicellulosiruptor hydrothermalis (strain DSM 18901 / VKM B-2411 / 108) TaxID=632292 RepID=E4QC06_CALH1|nr:PD-(D/E)XK nuclease family protein [Caldicellulosiruptor hydrothermalis]ADQ06180.1 conserved hypothetical protein [Caldicellulosiruptor hydrothermalis 108]